MRKKRICVVTKCGRSVHGKGFCHRHYQQLTKHGEIAPRTRYDDNEIIVEGDKARVVLYDNDGRSFNEAVIDAEDVNRITGMKWRFLNTKGYAVAGRGSDMVLMHRIITNAPEGVMVDHRNLDKLDNRKLNLRVCSSFQNAQHRGLTKANTTGRKGIYFHKVTGKWAAEVRAMNKKHWIGLYDTKEEAAFAYDKVANKLHGRFAVLNKDI